MAVAVTASRNVSTSCDTCDLPLYVAYAAPIVGPFIGAAIDQRFNRSLYISPAATKRISVAPTFQRTRSDMSVSISF